MTKGIYLATTLLSSYHCYSPPFPHVFYSLEAVNIALTVLNTADVSQLSKNTGNGKQETTFPLNFFVAEYCITLERHSGEVFYITNLILSLLYNVWEKETQILRNSRQDKLSPTHTQ